MIYILGAYSVCTVKNWIHSEEGGGWREWETRPYILLSKTDGKYFTTLNYLQTINFMALKIKFLVNLEILVVGFNFFLFSSVCISRNFNRPQSKKGHSFPLCWQIRVKT
jgi:hypothetical protein